MFRRFMKRMDQTFSIQVLGKIVLMLLVIYLLKVTSSVWGSWFGTLISILQPFIFGFLLAYVLHPLIVWLEKKGISKNISIIAVWIIIVVLFFLLCLVLLPMIYEKLSSFISNMIVGVQWVSDKIIQYGEFENFDLVDSITKTITDFLSTYDEWVPSIVSSLPTLMNTALNILTNTLFTIIIAIYMLFDFQRIKNCLHKFFCMFYSKSDSYLVKIDEDVSIYLRSLLILMIIKFCEYSLFYFLIGHEDWMIIGALTSIGLLIPYLGGTIANGIGILTALTLSPARIFFLIVGICILSNVDAYVISPLIHERRSSLGPLITLLAVFAGGVLYGAIGIMLSVPVAIAIKAICDVYQSDPNHHDEFHQKTM